MENLSQSMLRGYELRERIGSGGFGAVYKAYQSTIGREVAIKIILPGFANHPEFIRRFETEAHVIARLEHPHIVPLYDYWRDPDGAYLVMRWLRGGSLRDRLRLDGALDPASASVILDQIASGLNLAHRHDVIHRDIKPANILLDEDGNAYLADFGIAKDLTSLEDSHTGADDIVGSLDYLSPEQARSEPVTSQTDIYSLGVMLYEMLVGEHPFQSSSPVERLYKHINDPLPEIVVLDMTIRDSVNQVIQKATQKDPDKRFPDVLTFAADFREAVQATDAIAYQLTQREYDVLQRIVEGLSNKQIAEELFIATSTVKTYVKQIYRKLGVRSRVQATLRAHELNLLELGIGQEIPLSGSSSYLPEPENPYKGLRAFEAADHRDFFGREKLVEKLLDKMQDDVPSSRFLAIIGPSGSGKSSLVKAGLIPAIWNGRLPGSDRWFTIDMLPGAHPMDELEIALTRVSVNSVTNLDEQLWRDQRGLLRASQLILPADDTQLVLVIDQFEEVFTHVEDETQRQHFLDLLYTAITDSRSRIHVVITMRADYYDRPLYYPDFGDLLRSRMETILPLSAQQLERAIVGPTERIQVTFEEGLVAQIVSEMNYQAGALPLLQYALTELFELREGRVLTHDAYQQIGGAVGALAKRAETLFTEMNDIHQEITRQMFLRLVTPGEGTGDTRRRVNRSELMAIADQPDMMDEIIDHYTDFRLLSLDRDSTSRSPTVEVAHEAILSLWDRLRNWINRNREEIKMQQQLSRMEDEWVHAGQDSSYLASGLRLEQLVAWSQSSSLTLSTSERQFLEASISESERRQSIDRERKEREIALQSQATNRLRILVGTLALFLVVAVGLSVWALNQQAIASEQASIASTNEALANANLLEAQRAQSLLLSDLSRQELERGLQQDALGNAVESLANYPQIYNAESHQALLNALAYPVQDVEVLRVEHNDDALGAVLTENYIVSWSRDGVVRISDIETGVEKISLQHEKAVAGSAVNHDETRVITWTRDPIIYMWDMVTGTELRQMAHDGVLFGAEWSADGNYILSWSGDATVRIWNAHTGEELSQFGHGGTVFGARFNHDASQVISWTSEEALRVWDVETEDLALSLRHPAKVMGASWNTDGTQLVSWSADNMIHIWSLETATKVLTLSHDAPVLGASWNANETQLLSLSADQTLRVWEVTTGTELLTIHHDDRVLGAGWNADETQLLSWSIDNVVHIWGVATGNHLTRLTHDDRVLGATWSESDTTILSWSADDTVRLWDVHGGSASTIIHHESAVSRAVWSPDETMILTGTGAGTEDSGFQVVDAVYGETIFRQDVPMGWMDIISLLTWSPNSQHIVATSIWDIQSGQEIPFGRTTAQLDAYFSIYSWSPNSEFLMIGGSPDGWYPSWEVLDKNTGDSIWDHVSDMYSGVVEGFDWRNDGQQILIWFGEEGDSGHMNWPVYVVDAESGEIVLTLPHENAHQSASWNADSSLILTAAQDRTTRVWDAQTGNLIHEFPHDAELVGATWNDAGTAVLTWTSNGTIQLWDVETGSEIATMQYDSAVINATLNNDATELLSWSHDGTVQVWDAQAGEDLIILAHDTMVMDASWNATETHILSLAMDEDAVSIWDAETGERVLLLQHDDIVNGATWNADGTHILTWSDDGTARDWLIDIDVLLQFGKTNAVQYPSDE